MSGPVEDRGTTTISDKVVQKIATQAAAEASTISGHSGWTLRGRRDLPHASAQVAGGQCRVTIEMAAPWSSPLAQTAGHVREHVGNRVSALTGISVTAVGVSVVEIVRPTPRDQRRVE